MLPPHLRKRSKLELMQKFGVTGEYYYNIARAIDDREVCPVRERKSLGVEETFLHDLTDVGAMRMILKRQSEEVARDLHWKKLCGRTITLLTCDSFKFSCVTILWLTVLFPISIFVPVIGQILFIFLMGYRYGITYLLPTSYFHGIQVRELKRMFHSYNYRIAGFGVMVYYIMLMIPFATVFVLPGLVISEVQLYNDKLKENL